ncbi:MAG: von Willebrand factor type A domain-containing protein [Planctomycetota bacterium]|nr:von Willebrand factor type A domain-containing protein [Planctomycetota bacterium]
MISRKPSVLTAMVNPSPFTAPRTRSSRLLPLPLSLAVVAGFLVACRSEPAEQVKLREGSVDRRTVAESPFDSQNFNVVVGIGGGGGGAAAGPGSPGTVRGKYGGRLSYLSGGRAGQYGGALDGAGGEVYAELDLRGFIPTQADPRRTFAVDVDTAGYSNVRRILRDGGLPPVDAVRLEEMLNYFRYQDAPEQGGDPFGVTIELANCPWNPVHRLARVGISSQAIPQGYRQSANLVFLLDVSGSMNSADKLPLLKQSLHMLCQNLNGRDSVAIVVYAGAAGLVLPATSCANTDAILSSLSRLRAGGSTAGAAGIQLAYAQARENFIPGGINRVILATDGDFNVGISNRDELIKMIQKEAESGVSLTALGFGTGNLKDATLEQLADKGNGNYAYIDSITEARKVLVEELGATLETVAKDVKIQVTFDPTRVLAHRLLGYENRMLAHADFEDDKKDAGEIGAGHGVTALFELVPVGTEMPDLEDREDDPDAAQGHFEGPGMMRVDLRYKRPGDGDESSLLTSFHAEDTGSVMMTATDDLRFAAAVAWFAEELRSSTPDPEVFAALRPLAASSLGEDSGGWRAGFLEMVDLAQGAAQRKLEEAEASAEETEDEEGPIIIGGDMHCTRPESALEVSRLK